MIDIAKTVGQADRSARRSTGAYVPLLARVRFQLLAGLLIVVAIPFLLRMAAYSGGTGVTASANTMTGSSIAFVLAYFVWRRLGSFPGVQGRSFILPAIAFGFGAILLIFFTLRLDYSRYQFTGSMVLASLWFFICHLLSERLVRLRLGMVPGGNIEALRAIPGVEWVDIKDPQRLPPGLNGIVADLRADMEDRWERFIADCTLARVPVFHLKQVAESLTGRVSIEHLSENTFGTLLPSNVYSRIKGVTDWILAALCLPFFLVLYAIVGLAIKMDSEGPILFRQMRMGQGARPFRVYKFRTMTVANSAPGAGLADMASDEDLAEREAAKTVDGDSRVTRVGRFLRRMRIDEVPQILNILRGEMSWIGPRPEALPLSLWYEEELPYYRYRHIIRPGISGWAQVNQGHVAEIDDVHEKLYYDFYYIKHFSPWLDILIIERTIRTILSGFGAR